MDGSDYQLHSEAMAAWKAARDRDDLQLEIAGLNVGRQKRFRPDDEQAQAGQKRSAERTFETLSALERKLQSDAEYAALYYEVREDVARIELIVVDAKMAAYQDAMAEAADILGMRERAGKLPDGTIVFRSETGEVFTEDGVALAPGMEDDVTWQENSPSWEDFSAANERYEAAMGRAHEIEAYERDYVQPTRDRLEDNDDPATKEEWKQRQDDLYKKAPDFLKGAIAGQDESPQVLTDSTPLASTMKPTL